MQKFTEQEMQIFDKIKGSPNYLKANGKWVSFNKTVPSVLKRQRKERELFIEILKNTYVDRLI